MNSIKVICEQLGFSKDNGLFFFRDKNWRNLFSQKTEYALEKIKPDAFYCFNNEPLILFFDYPEYESEIHKKCWNFNKAPIIFINTRSGLKIYNGFSFDTQKGLLHILTTNKTEIERFSYWNFVTGQLWKEYEKEFSKKKRLDYKLLQNIDDARSLLIEEENLVPSIANKLIGRLIFTRYLIDRKIKIDFNENNNGFLSNEELLALIRDRDALYKLFEFLNSRFKGDLFPLDGEKYDVEQKHLEVLYHLFNGDEIKTGQLSLFNIYNFDIIPVEFVSNIYEYFIGKDKQEKSKSFYTPPFLVDCILSQTVGIRFKKENSDVGCSCKVLDPACGSGIFLVETLRLIILQFKKSNPHLKPAQSEFKEAIKKLLVDNIFGIDKDRDALEIAIFSLYITLLDFFEEPRDINGFEFPNLLGTNLIEADFFDTNHPFNRKFGHGDNKIKLDFILGNPPWGQIESPYMNYIKSRSKKENIEIKVSDRQIAQAFMLRVSDFSSQDTKCCFIVSSKVLYNLQANKFREYFLKKFYIDEVFEISSVRKQIFAKAVGPAAVIKYRYACEKETLNNKVVHISLKPNPFFTFFKSILIEKYDYKEIKQRYFSQYDWLWKVLLYGTILDFYFVKRLKNPDHFPQTIESIIKSGKNKLIYGEGIQRTGDKRDASHLIGKQLLDTNKKDLERYHVRLRENSIWENPYAHRPKGEKQDLFKAPMLLIKSGLEVDYKLVASISEKDAVFTHSIFAIKSYDKKLILEKLLGLINSDLMTYYIFINGSSTGVEREQIISRELYPFPVILNEEVAIKTRELLELHNKEYEAQSFRLGGYNAEIELAERELNELIFKLYNLNETEKDLLDYAFKVSIPLLQDKKSHRAFKRLTQEELEEYARLFVNHFSQFHNDDENGYFQVEIYRTSSVVAIDFKITPRKPDNILIQKNSYKSEKVIELIAGTAFQKVSNYLFIQKDVKGIRKDSFYVIKPNQYKYWHRAIARLDIIEFENSMLKSQLEKKGG
jgi:hypothetical protein